jgi:molybdate transport system substrate-binding protein
MRSRLIAAALLTVLVVSGCQSTPADTVVVFAAASLTKTFTALGNAFTDAGSDAAVELSFAGSADLLTQLTHGAEADVFAAADIATMNKAVTADLLDGPPVSFATNTLTIVVEPGNPKGVNSFQDLNRVRTAICAVQVPCGSAVPRLQSRTGVRLQPVSEETSVSDVLNRVSAGQADAGLVYLTDARAAGDKVRPVDLPEAFEMPNTYQIGVLRNARNPVLARRFVDIVTGPVGRQILSTAGFGHP